jgi:small subunit ribosomal protein S1
MSDNDFAKLLEESEQNALAPGQIVKGIIHEIMDDTVFIDVGFKSEGKLSISEFSGKPELNDEVDVYIERLEDASGNIIVSKKKADAVIDGRRIVEAFKTNTPVKGKILSVAETKEGKKSGFIVDIGKESFCPFSMIDIHRVKGDGSEYVGKEFDFIIIEHDTRNKKVVVSRRTLLEKQKKEEIEKFFSTVKEGDAVEGTVKTVQKAFVFIEVAPFVDAYCHISELSYQRAKSASDLVKAGDTISVKVTSLSPSKGKVEVSAKALMADPWDKFSNEYFGGEVVEGTVADIIRTGAFVNVSEGVDGFVPLDNISWVKKVKNPKDLLSVGQKVKAKIININKADRKLTLDISQLLDNPWDKIEKKYPVGSKINGKVKNITQFGAFIELEEKIEGLLHKNDVSWDSDKNNTSGLNKGDEIEVMILNFDKKEQTISLGLKQIDGNPWQDFLSKHPKGSTIKGIVKELTDAGAVITLFENVEGFMHVSEISRDRIEKPADVLTIGQEVEVVIIDANLRKNRISLSIKALEKMKEQKEIQKYTSMSDEKPATLGDMFDFSKINLSKKK